ncbi:hypothetical protein Bandiella_00502 [Candidatus Bandiella woodruffii]|uniref:Uncharacterized protein n=1 Tax=Candidatus Bandiella euplotis TaxID=1664265 RepID=A0ABZ0UMB5_9RICK|nr:hypothetical protein Bandiella_00502 [Candidatus Bandiella woodruffii]
MFQKIVDEKQREIKLIEEKILNIGKEIDELSDKSDFYDDTSTANNSGDKYSGEYCLNQENGMNDNNSHNKYDDF